jgi:hypothetical protein
MLGGIFRRRGIPDRKCRVTIDAKSVKMRLGGGDTAGGLGCILPQTPSRGARDERGGGSSLRAPNTNIICNARCINTTSHNNNTARQHICPMMQTSGRRNYDESFHFVLCIEYITVAASLAFHRRCTVHLRYNQYFLTIYAVSTGATSVDTCCTMLRSTCMSQPHVRLATTPLKESKLTSRVQPRIRSRMQTRVGQVHKAP